MKVSVSGIVLMLGFLIFAADSESRISAAKAGMTYYIDASAGDDGNDGLRPDKAWRTLDKVNGWTFGPGDRILFKSGGYWSGVLKPRGSGAEGNPIIVDRYGEGGKPIIDGAGTLGGVIVLHNQEYWEWNNLELMNDAPHPGDRRGVEITASNYGTVHHIHIKNMTIHDVKGIIGHEMDAKRTAGIYVATLDDTQAPTRFDDVLIEGNTIFNIENQGIVTTNEVKVNDYPGTEDWNKRRFTNVAIRNNTIYNISKNAIIVRLTDGGVVEHNVAYNTATAITGNTYFSRSVKGTVFQYNEGYLNQSPGRDGSMYDADLQSPETIWQYSYSHDNAHGLMWFCTDEKDTDIIVRYNISQNDRGILLNVNYAFTSASIYNNVFYIDSKLSPTIIEETNKKHTYSFYNNIIYNNSPTATYKLDDSNTVRTLENNVFFGYHPESEPEDLFKLTSDPMLAAPGSGGIGMDTVEGYKLLKGSPAIGSGQWIPDNGGKDFWNHPVSSTQAPNRGVYNGPGEAVPFSSPVLLEAAPDNGQIRLKWSNVTNVTGYTVWYGTESGNGQTVVDAGNVNEYAVDGLTNGATYYFAVSAYKNKHDRDACNDLSSSQCRISNELSVTLTTSVVVSEDAYVRGGSYANQNYGGEKTLIVKRGKDPSFFREAFISADLSDVGDASLTSAVLHVHVSSNDPSSSLTVFGLSDVDWSEEELTWNNKPNDPNRLELVTIPINGTGWYSIDVTEYARNRMPDGTVTFQFTDENALNKQVALSSKESDAPAYLTVIESPGE